MGKETTQVDTSRGQIAVREDGSPDVPILVLCQRFQGGIEDWDPRFIDALARQRRVVRFDMPGIGASPGDMPDSVQGMAKVVAALLDALDLQQVDLLGWSLGGYMAQAVTLTWPHRVRRLVIAGSGPGGPNAPARDPRVGEITAKDPTRDEIAYLFFPETEEGRVAAVEHLDLIAYGQRPSVRRGSSDRQRTAITQWTKGIGSARPRLGELAVPVLVANGVHDVMVPAENSFAIAREAPDAKLVIYPRSGHAFLFQFAEDFANEVERFLAMP
jgi:pimeloyl-ACP methyl ester carboxylesterase